jgi:hypothetical protein
MESLKKTLDKPLKATILFHITKENQMSDNFITIGKDKKQVEVKIATCSDHTIVMKGGVQVATVCSQNHLADAKEHAKSLCE